MSARNSSEKGIVMSLAMSISYTLGLVLLGAAGRGAMGDGVNDIPTHIVCHTEGCAEVKARLATIQQKQKVAQQKLDECSRDRKQLADDLAKAAAIRGKAEKALAQCAAERAKLTEELRQCAEVDRPNAEKALAKCARERSQLEAELKQCAEVDRPNAEKALAQCGKDRAKLEAQLAKVVQALKKKAAG